CRHATTARRAPAPGPATRRCGYISPMEIRNRLGRSEAPMKFHDRRQAGRLLAQRVAAVGLERPLVLALPRGGVPIGYEVAQALAAPLEVFVARKLGAPYRPELGIGAIAEGGRGVIDEHT